MKNKRIDYLIKKKGGHTHTDERKFIPIKEVAMASSEKTETSNDKEAPLAPLLIDWSGSNMFDSSFRVICKTQNMMEENQQK